MPPLLGGYSIIVRLNYMCEFLLSLIIVGAFEIEPGWMTIDHIDRTTMGSTTQPPVVERIHVPTDQYIGCYE